jgi:predicted negative regulator of RcsB-dependent stress response
MYDLEEQEKLDELKAWWKQYGQTVIVVAVAACLGAAAAAGWQWYKRTQAEQASQLYGTLEKAVQANDLKQIRDVSAQLMDKFGGTAYGPMAALAGAKANFDAGDADGAASQLRWAIDHARDEGIAATARLRLAAVLLDEKKYDDALKLLGPGYPDAYAGLVEDQKGDIYVAQGKTGEARAAYKAALEKLPAQGTYRQIVQVKLDGLGGDQ